MPPAMKKTTRQSGARGRSTTPASSRASKSVASRASKSSVSASRSRARTGGGKPSKSALGTAAARSSTVVGRAAQKRDADDTARGSKLKTMRRPAADAAEGLEEPEEEGPVVSEAKSFLVLQTLMMRLSLRPFWMPEGSTSQTCRHLSACPVGA